MTGKKYTVGQMAELCDISKKQLRYYDQIGLLTPEYRDALTSYRYYTDDQIEEILLLKELKKLNMPLETIGRLMAKRNLPQLQAVLQEHLSTLRGELEQRQRQYDQLVDMLLRLVQSSTLVGHADQDQIRIVDFPEKKVLFTRYMSPWNANQLFINRRAELLKMAESMNLQVTGPNYAIFHSGYIGQFSNDPENSKGDLVVCLEISKASAVGSPYVRTIAPFRAVACVYFGHYKNMKDTYLNMKNWAYNNNLDLSDKSIEEYLVGATNTSNSNDYITKLYIPLKGSAI